MVGKGKKREREKGSEGKKGKREGGEEKGKEKRAGKGILAIPILVCFRRRCM